MKTQFSRQFNTLSRVSAFGEKHSDLFPPTTFAGKMFGVIADAISELRKNDGSQAAGFAMAKEGVNQKTEAREALREALADLSGVARSIDREQPGFAAQFELSYDLSDTALLALALGFVTNATPLAAVFVEHDLPPTFVRDLESAIARLEDAIRGHVRKKDVHKSATAAIEATMDNAMDALFRLDGVVAGKIRKDPTLLREWETARHIAVPRTSKPVDPVTSPPAETASAAAA